MSKLVCIFAVGFNINVHGGGIFEEVALKVEGGNEGGNCCGADDYYY